VSAFPGCGESHRAPSCILSVPRSVSRVPMLHNHSVSEVNLGCAMGVLGMYQGCIRDVSGMYQGCTRDVSGMHQGVSAVWGVSGMLQECAQCAPNRARILIVSGSVLRVPMLHSHSVSTVYSIQDVSGMYQGRISDVSGMYRGCTMVSS
jgi:hypothetical protein